MNIHSVCVSLHIALRTPGSTLFDQMGQERNDAACRYAGANVDPQGTTVDLVDDVERPEHLAVVERVPHEVERPNATRPPLDEQQLALSCRDTSLRPARQVQKQLAVHPPPGYLADARGRDLVFLGHDPDGLAPA